MLILLTHYHWDHICGLPFFKPAFIPDWNISFFAPGQSTQEIKQNLDAQMQAPYFPVGTGNWIANINYICPLEAQIYHGSIKITYHNVHHPGITYGYRITALDKTIIYIPDNECMFLNKSIEQKITQFNKEEQEMFKTMNHEEYQYELDAIQDADILIHDAQYTPNAYQTKRGWGHSCYIDTVNSAIDAGVKELYLYHHDPCNDDSVIDIIYENSMQIIQKRNASLKCYIARENMIVNLD